MSNDPEFLCWLGLASCESAIIALHAGFRHVVIDCEHGTIGVETMAAMIAVARAAGATVYVRVPELSEAWIKHALDSGAGGVIVPYVETVEEAKRAVRAAFYAPVGARGSAVGVIAASGYGAEAEYVERWNRDGRLILQIESRAGVAAAADIAAVPGVTDLFFGPYDYAQGAGLDPAADSAELEAVFAGVARAADQAGKGVGVFPWPGATPAELARTGAGMIAVASDIVTLKAGLTKALQVASLSSSAVS